MNAATKTIIMLAHKTENTTLMFIMCVCVCHIFMICNAKIKLVSSFSQDLDPFSGQMQINSRALLNLGWGEMTMGA